VDLLTLFLNFSQGYRDIFFKIDCNYNSKPPADAKRKDFVTERTVISSSTVSTIPPSVSHGVGGGAAQKCKLREDFSVLQLDVLDN